MSVTPATASLHTSTSSATPTSPTRPSRLRGLSYLRSYTRDHLHPNNTGSGTAAPPLTRSTSSPVTASVTPVGSPQEESRTRLRDSERSTAESSNIQSAENGWVPTVQGRSGLSRSSLHPTSTSTDPASPEPSNSTASPATSTTMARSRAATAGAMAPSTRRQSATEATNSSTDAEPSSSSNLTSTSTSAGPSKDAAQHPTIRFIPHVEPRSARPSLHFTALTRTLKTPATIVRVGRYSERDNASPEPNTLPVGFKSKVVSRRHCELWCTNGQWYIKDVKSSSGTFLNHVRLSSPGQESRPFPVNDGDVVQLGIDFKGGEEVIFRCVKIRIECNRGWQKSLNAYNTSAHKRLLKNAGVRGGRNRDSDAASVNGSSECSICLNPVAPCQALFVAPCSHVWHYKCVRNLIHGPSWPNFLCPNCRFVADLEAEVEPAEEEEEEGEFDEEEGEENGGEGVEGEGREQNGSSSTDELREDGGEGGDGERGAEDEADEARERGDPRNGNLTDDELASMMEQSSLSNAQPSPSQAAASRPVPIPPPHHNNQRTTSSDLLGARSATPTSHAQFALAAGVHGLGDGGPMTPRNDAGPFVLDGRAGRGGRDVLGEEEEEREGR